MIALVNCSVDDRVEKLKRDDHIFRGHRLISITAKYHKTLQERVVKLEAYSDDVYF